MRPLLRSTTGDGLAAPSPSSPHFEQSLSGAAGEQQQAISVDSDMVVILASLLCALISVIGLALVARCACRWPRQARTRSNSSSCPAPARGLKKKAIEALPTVSFVQGGRKDGGGGSSECAICLAEFLEGEELRVLPHCRHAFHVVCIDAWLGAQASCPSCRAAIMVPAAVVGRCRRCGAACDLDVEHADGTTDRAC